MVISVIEFKNRFKQLFGPHVWADFLSFGNNNSLNDKFNSMEEAWGQIIKYKNKYGKISNFYKRHKQFTRFVLISIERKYREASRTITFSAPLKTGNKKYDKEWEVEHIFPSKGPKCFDNIINVSKKPDSCPKEGTNRNEQIEKITRNSICNLTLISRELNGDEDYKIEDFQTKKDVMNSPKKEKDVMNPAKKEYYEEKDFYINRIFKNRSAKPSKDYFRLLLARQLNLKFDFNRIFKPDATGIPVVFFEDVLGYSEGAIKSTPHITHLIRKGCKKRRRLK